MHPLTWHRRLLPVTLVLLALLFVDKAVGLAREAAAKDALPAMATVPPVVAAPDINLKLNPDLQAGATPPVAAITPVELALLQSLKARRKQLDDRERVLNQRSELLQVAELKLQSKLDDLARLKSQLEDTDQTRQKQADANWSGLVKMYEDMKPGDAANIFNVLDMQVSLEVLDRMDVRKAAAVLSNMLPERARIVTQMLAMKRTRQASTNASTILSANR